MAVRKSQTEKISINSNLKSLFVNSKATKNKNFPFDRYIIKPFVFIHYIFECSSKPDNDLLNKSFFVNRNTLKSANIKTIFYLLTNINFEINKT